MLASDSRKRYDPRRRETVSNTTSGTTFPRRAAKLPGNVVTTISSNPVHVGGKATWLALNQVSLNDE